VSPSGHRRRPVRARQSREGVAELTRHLRTLEGLRPEVLVGQLGGATGTLASLGPAGLAVRRDLMRDLELGEPAITWHVARDRLTHLAFVFGLVAASLQRAALEIVTLQRTEVEEVLEPFHDGKVGSSTMPHKRNPVLSETMWTLGELVRNDVRAGLSSLGSLHERDKAVYTVEVDYLPRVCKHTHRLLAMVPPSGIQQIRSRQEDKVYVWPHLLTSEFIALMVVTVFLTLFSAAVVAPLLELANPGVTPNPSKAPWYFMGLQELLAYFHPTVAGVTIPTVGLLVGFALPYFDKNPSIKPENRKFAVMAFTFAMMFNALLVITGSFFRGPGFNWVWPWVDGLWFQP
jgi:hypothetical protein